MPPKTGTDLSGIGRTRFSAKAAKGKKANRQQERIQELPPDTVLETPYDFKAEGDAPDKRKTAFSPRGQGRSSKNIAQKAAGSHEQDRAFEPLHITPAMCRTAGNVCRNLHMRPRTGDTHKLPYLVSTQSCMIPLMKRKTAKKRRTAWRHRPNSFFPCGRHRAKKGLAPEIS